MTTRDRLILEMVRCYRLGDAKRVVMLDAFARQTGSDYQEVEDIAADLRSEGSISVGALRGNYRLTDAGYARYNERMRAIEALENNA